MKLFKIAKGTNGYKIKWPHVVRTTVKRDIVAEQGLSKEAGTYWLTNDPIMQSNGSRPCLPKTIGWQMTNKGYSTITTFDSKGKEHTLFVPFEDVEAV